MIITHFTPSNFTYQKLLREQLLAFSHEYTVKCISSFNVEEVDCGIHLLSGRFYRRLGKIFHSTASLIGRRRDIAEADIFHVHTPMGLLIYILCLPILILYSCKPKKCIFTAHGMYFTNKNILFLIESLCFLFFDKVLFQSKDDYRHVVSLRFMKKRAIWIGNGVNLDTYLPRAQSKDKMDKIKFIFVGRLTTEKGIHELVAAFKKIHGMSIARYVSLTLCGGVSNDERNGIFSTESTENDFIAECAEFGIDYIGFNNNIPKILAEHDVFILPSYREGVPRSMIEAICVGLALAGSNIRGCSELIEDGLNGFLFSRKSSNDIVDTVYKFCQNYDLVRDFKEYNLSIRERHSERHVFARINQCYADLLQ